MQLCMFPLRKCSCRQANSGEMTENEGKEMKQRSLAGHETGTFRFMVGTLTPRPPGLPENTAFKGD